MVFYVKQGKITESRHTFDDSKHILREELFGEESFDGPYSLLYHEREPTRVKSIRRIEKKPIRDGSQEELRHRHLKGFQVSPHGDFINGRTYLMFNEDMSMGLIKPGEETNQFFRSALNEQLFYVQKGEGVLNSPLGALRFSRGDYVYVPKGTTYEIKYEQGSEFFFVESKDRLSVPPRYLNIYGQIKEGSPYYTRDIRYPVLGEPNLSNGDFKVLVDFGDYYLEETRDQHPFDVAGWDGYLFPWAVNISLMAPIVGRLHQPPPVHETFSSRGFMVGTFLPRKYDFHPRAIPISYYHSNIDTDEVLFYSSGNFMSRKGISEGSLTLHVRGLIHGPQPGAVEGAIGKEGTDEIAVMVEAYKPLKLTREALGIEDTEYMSSWYS
jgi:homogentisate 1,2-dioxygenase